jgi:hypothetical protein
MKAQRHRLERWRWQVSDKRTSGTGPLYTCPRPANLEVFSAHTRAAIADARAKKFRAQLALLPGKVGGLIHSVRRSDSQKLVTASRTFHRGVKHD